MPKSYKSRARKAALRTRGGFVTPPTWAQPTLDKVEPYMRAALKVAAKDISDAGLGKLNEFVAKATVPQAVKVGAKTIGKLAGVDNDVVGGGKGPTGYVQTDTERTRIAGSNSYPMKQHYTKFVYGRPSTRAVRQLSKLNGKSNIEMYNTIYQNPATTPREALRAEAGFNQKVIFFQGLARVTGDMMSVQYGLPNDFLPISAKEQNIYGMTLNLWRKLKLMNTNKFLPMHVTIKLWKRTNTDQDGRTNFTLAFNTDPLVQQVDKFPIRYQLKAVDTKESIDRVLIDPNVSLERSPYWMSKYERVKTFKKKLNPGEIWNYHEELQCGSGLNLSHLEALDNEQTLQTLGYEMTVEVKGVPCEAIYGGNNDQHIIGTSPCFIQMEVSRGHESVLRASDEGDYSTLTSGGLVSTTYAIRAFTKRPAGIDTQKIVNVDVANVVSDPAAFNTGGNVHIPVMTDTSIQYSDERGD